MATTNNIFDKTSLQSALTAFFQQNPPTCPAVLNKYVAATVWNGKPYWTTHVRSSRFQETLEKGILYRPQIVNSICDEIETALNKNVRSGIIVKGPQGVGKSHSLVNTVLKLESTKNYLVTFVPDCDSWVHEIFLIEQICKSFSSSPSELGISFHSGYDYEYLYFVLVEAIDEHLTSLNKKWVFVFDQINRIFLRFKDINDVSGLPFPYRAMKSVLKAGRITSVISASANNEIAYEDQHEGFDEYQHGTNMTNDELRLALGDLTEGVLQDVQDNTDGVPLYALLYVDKGVKFQASINTAVLNSLQHLRPKDQYHVWEWEIVVRAILSSLLLLKSGAEKYDKKFMIRESANEEGTEWRYRPLFPAVQAAYRTHLWKELMAYVEENEVSLLDVCRDPETTNDTRGRLFETIVIRRCQSRQGKIQVGDNEVTIQQSATRFNGKLLPKLTKEGTRDGIFIPNDPNFPAIDLVWKCGGIVLGVQCHVNQHKDVAAYFWGLCNKANWLKNFDEVHLLYLSPESAVADLVDNRVAQRTYSGRQTQSIIESGNNKPIYLRSISRESVTSLADIAWPHHCSL